MIDIISTYDTLMAYHAEKAGEASIDSGAWHANQSIKNELLHLKHGFLQLSEEKGLLLLQEKLRQQLHYLHEVTEYDREVRWVYLMYLSRNSKVPKATVIEVYNQVKQYIREERFTTMFGALCYGVFLKAITTGKGVLRQDITIPSMRDYLLFAIDATEKASKTYTVKQRQEAVGAFIEILSFLQ